VARKGGRGKGGFFSQTPTCGKTRQKSSKSTSLRYFRSKGRFLICTYWGRGGKKAIYQGHEAISTFCIQRIKDSVMAEQSGGNPGENTAKWSEERDRILGGISSKNQKRMKSSYQFKNSVNETDSRKLRQLKVFIVTHEGANPRGITNWCETKSKLEINARHHYLSGLYPPTKGTKRRPKKPC